MSATILTISSEVCIPVDFTVSIDDETGLVELSSVSVTGPMRAAILASKFFENLPKREEECLIELAKEAITEEKKAQQERDEITDAENSMWIGGRY